VKVLLDHCTPRRFGLRLIGHDVRHTSRVGMSKFANGALLAAASAGGFEVLLTVDTNLAKQQAVGELPLAVIVVIVPRNTEAALSVHLPEIMALLGQRLQRRVYVVGKSEGKTEGTKQR